MQNAIENWISHVYVGCSHIDFCSENTFAVLEFAIFHAHEQIEILFDATIAAGRILAGFSQRTAVDSDLIGGLIVDIGLAFFYQQNSPVKKLLEII